MESESTRSDLRPSQIQYQLLTAKLAISDAFDSTDDAPEGVNDALARITTAMNLLSDEQMSVSEAEPDSLTFQNTGEVVSKVTDNDWDDISQSEFVDVAKSPISHTFGLVFDHPEIGLHGVKWHQHSATLEPVVYERNRGGDDGDD